MTPETLRVYRDLQHCGEENACGIAALSIVSGQPVEIVRRAMAVCGRRPGEGSREDYFRMAARLLGLKIRQVSASEGIRLAKAGWSVFLHTHDHIFAATEGRLHDPSPFRYFPALNGAIVVENSNPAIRGYERNA